MTPPTTETMIVVNVLSISFTEKREREEDIVREDDGNHAEGEGDETPAVRFIFFNWLRVQAGQ